MKLYELKEEYDNYLDAWNESEEGSQEEAELETILNALEDSLDNKLDSVISYMKSLLAEAEALKAESKKLTDRAKSSANKAERLKDYIVSCMNDNQKWKNERHSVSWHKSTSVNVVDETKVPYNFIKVTTSVDKIEAAKALKAGKTVGGLELKHNNNIVIK